MADYKLKATRNYLSPVTASLDLVGSNKLFNYNTWKQAIKDGNLDLYVDVLMKSNSMDLNDFYEKYKIPFGNTDTIFSALVNEFYPDKTPIKTGELLGLEKPKKSLEQQAKEREMKSKGLEIPLDPYDVETTKYDYVVKQISEGNIQYATQMLQQYANQLRVNQQGFNTLLNDVVAGFGNLAGGIYSGISKIAGAVGSLFMAIDKDNGKLDDNYFDRILYSYNKVVDTVRIDSIADAFAQWEYNYTHLYDENGNQKRFPSIIKSATTSIGEMIPSMLLGQGIGSLVGTIAGATGATAAGITKATQLGTKIASNTLFYGSNIFMTDMGEQYKYFSERGMSIPTGQVYMKAGVKAGLQFGVEFLLGKVFGSTGLDQFKGMNDKGMFTKAMSKVNNPTGRAILNFVGDAIQESAEESFQETTDFLTDSLFHYWNNNFESKDWSWQSIWDAAAAGAISSLLGGSARIIGTERVSVGRIKTNKNGELVFDDNGKPVYKSMNKLASYQYGLDMQSFVENYQSVINAGEKLSKLDDGSGKYDKVMLQYKTAYTQAVIAQQLMTDYYGAIGKERFEKANEVLKSITKSINDGKFDASTIEANQEAITVDISSWAKSNAKLQASKIKESIKKMGATEVSHKVDTNDINTGDEKVDKISKDLADKTGAKEIVYTKDGDRPQLIGDLLIIPERLAFSGGAIVSTFSVAELEIVEAIAEEIVKRTSYQKGAIQILEELYMQWTGYETTTAEEVITTLLFDYRFFEVVLSVNERLSSDFVLSLNHIADIAISKNNKLKDHLIVKRIDECLNRCMDAALDFYSNNLNADTSKFTDGFTKSQRDKFNKELSRRLLLFNMGRDIILNPDNVSKEVWDFIERRINNISSPNVTEETKNRLLKQIHDNRADIREQALNEISSYYNNMFNTLYNGEYYMPMNSVANMSFNTWIQSIGYNISNFLSKQHLSESDLLELGENFSDADILKLRRDQLKSFTNGSIDFGIENGKVVIVNDFDGLNEIGYKQYESLLYKEYENPEVTKKIPTTIKNISKWLKNLLSDDVNDLYSTISVNDLIMNHGLLRDSIRDQIADIYGTVNAMTTFLYIRDYISENEGGKWTVTVKADGTFILAEMTNIDTIFDKDVKLPTSGEYLLSQFLSPAYKNSFLANVTIRFGAKDNQYVSYERKVVDGKYVYVFVNRIDISTSTRNKNKTTKISQALLKTLIAHEYTHAYQTAMRLNTGIFKNPLKAFSPKVQNEIVNDVKELYPNLFVDSKSRESDKEIVNRFLYHATGESFAFGLGRYASFYPIRISQTDDVVKLTLQNGKTYIVPKQINQTLAIRNILFTVNDLLNKSFSKYFVNKQTDRNILTNMSKAKKEVNYDILSNKNTTKENYIELLYQSSSTSLSKENFENSSCVCVIIGDKKYFVTSIKDVEGLLNFIYSSIDTQNNKASIIIGTFKPKNIKSFKLFDINESFGEVEIDKGYISNVKTTVVDLVGLSNEATPQSLWLDSLSAVTGKVSYTTNDFNDIDGEFAELVNNVGEHFENHKQPIWDRLQFYYKRSTRYPFFDDIISPWYNFKVGNKTYDEQWRADALNRIKNTPLFHKQNLIDLKNYIGYSDISFEEFLELELPILRIQDNDTLYESPFVPVSLVTSIDSMSYLLHAKEGMIEENDGEITFVNKGTFFFGKIKVKDILLFLPNDLNELWVKPDTFVGGFTLDSTSNAKNTTDYSFATFEFFEGSLIKNPVTLSPYDYSYVNSADLPVVENGMYTGPLYENGIPVTENASAFNVCDITDVDDSRKLVKIIRSCGIDIKNRTVMELIHSIFYGNNKSKQEEFVRKFMTNDEGFTSLYIGGRFLIWNGRVGNFSTFVQNTDTSNKQLTDNELSDELNKIKKEAPVKTTEAEESDVNKEKPKKKKPKKKKYPFDPNTMYKERTSSAPKHSIIERITDPEILEGYPTHERVTARYLHRELIEVQRYRDSNGEIKIRNIYEYINPKKDNKTRTWVTKSELSTDLKYFKKPGKQLKLNANVRRFVIAATGKEIASEIREKINNGTLKEQDLLDYIVNNSAKDIDNNTFILIRDTFSDNKSIKNAYDLEQLSSSTSRMAVAIYLLGKNNKEIAPLLQADFDTEGIEKLYELLSRNEGFAKKLESITVGFDKAVGLRKVNEEDIIEGKYDSLIIDEKYLKETILKRYNGKIANLSAIAITARDNAYLGFKSRFSSVKSSSMSKSVGSNKYGQSIGALENLLKDDDGLSEFMEVIENVLTNIDSDSKISSIVDVEGRSIGPKLIYSIITKKIGSGNLNLKESFLSFLNVDNFKKFVENFNSSNDKLETYNDYISNLSEDELNKFFSLVQIINVSSNQDYYKDSYNDILDNITGTELDSATIIDTVNKIVPNKYNLKKRCLGFADTISKRVSSVKDINRFLKKHNDLFTKDKGKLQLRDSVIYDIVDGKKILKSADELLKLIDELKEISNAAKKSVYTSNSNVKSYERMISEGNNTVKELQELLKHKKESKYVTVAYKGSSEGINIDVKTKNEIPSKLKTILSKGLGKLADSRVQEINTYTETVGKDGKIVKTWDNQHLQNIMKDFIEVNSETLLTLNQDEALEIINFLLEYVATVSESERAFVGAQEILIAYFLNEHRTGRYDFSETLVEGMENKLEEMARFFGAGLSNWRTALKGLRTVETMVQSMSMSLGIELDEEDELLIEKMCKAIVKTNSKSTKDDIVKYDADFNKHLQEFKENLLKKHKSNKNIWDKLLLFESVMMLSSPGTWLRNQTSNIVVRYGNKAADWTGEKLTDLVIRLFPKTKKALRETEGQYRLNKSADKQIVDFVETSFIQTKILDKAISGISKLNIDRVGREKASTNIVEMLSRSAISEISKTCYFNNKTLDGFSNLVFKMISDDASVKKSIEKYYPLILQEDYENTVRNESKRHYAEYQKTISEFKANHNKKSEMTYEEFSKLRPKKEWTLKLYLEGDSNNIYGVNNRVVEAFAKAVSLASYEHMHTANAWTYIEKSMRDNWSPFGYFMYKQIFPFLSSNWNWFVEGLRYTPAGLVKSIIDLCKLQSSIDNIHKRRIEGSYSLNESFVQKMKIRNIGKGAIGTFMLALGMMLFALGWAECDDEDNKYKITIGDIKIDISDILGSEGLTMGIAFANTRSENGILKAFGAVLDDMFRDSMFENLLKLGVYNGDTISEYAVNYLWDMPTKFYPNMLKSIATVFRQKNITYSPGVAGRLQRLLLNFLPLPAEWVLANSYTDIYTGERQAFWSVDLLFKGLSTYSPVDISYVNVSRIENEAISLGIKHKQLKGSYTIDGLDVQISTKDQALLNQFYGKQNNKELTKLLNNESKIKVKLDNGTYKELRYSQMTDKQKEAAIETIMSNNSSLGKIYILTSSGRFKYYASDSVYAELKKLGVTKNVYRKTKRLSGFVPN